MTGARTARSAWPLAVIGAVLAIAGCGGNSHKSTSSSSTSSTSTTTHAKAKAKAPTGPTVVTEQVLGRGGKKLSSSIKAKPGTAVVLRTLVPGSKTDTHKMTVKLTADAGPSKTLTITASGKGHTSVAKIHSANGKPITLLDLRYTCSLPPAPTFCPGKDITGSSKGYKLTFSSAPVPGISLAAFVGPITTKTPVVRTPTTGSAAPYTPTELVKATTPPKPGSKAKPPATTIRPTSTTTAKPGDSLSIVTRLVGKPVGQPQPVTVTINQGPAKAVTIVASVANGQTSTATVTRSNGKKLAIVLPRFGCAVPPQPTICPPTNVSTAAHQYKLTFMASPYTHPISISAVIQGG